MRLIPLPADLALSASVRHLIRVSPIRVSLLSFSVMQTAHDWKGGFKKQIPQKEKDSKSKGLNARGAPAASDPDPDPDESKAVPGER
jgi:hypothetical protein